MRVDLERRQSLGIEKGYFKEAGIKLEVEELDTSANVLAMLAQNRLQIIEGGVSAGYFNGLREEPPDHHRDGPGVERRSATT